ncbi:MAG: aldo/keto reductase [Deltaproteobacteria bacterium]|nr:aldo/keto reductase [Deltaproteobacteria bacterium]
MCQEKKYTGIDRREFLRMGLAGTTSVFLGWDSLADAMQIAAAGPFVFPAPVYRTLGRTGLKITIVSFGAMLTPEPEVMEIAFDHGVNYVDTARRYMGGRNEETVGRALKGKRDKIYVATKISPASRSKEAIFKDVETSLRELGTDHVDIIQLHNVTGREDRISNPEIRETLVRLKEQGKVRFFGVTSHTNEAEVLNALVDDKDRFFDTALVKYNFKSNSETKEAIARAARANIGVIAMKTLAGGYAADMPGPFSPHQAAIKWALQDEHVAATIPGMRNITELREDIAVMGMSFGYIDQLLLKRYGAAVASDYCHLCGQCEATCPNGVAISTINRCLMYAVAYRSPALAKSTYHEIPSSLSASTCLDCSECVAKCNNGLDIPVKMKMARKLLT